MNKEGYSFLKVTSMRELCNALVVNETPFLDINLLRMFSAVSTSTFESQYWISVNIPKKSKKHFRIIQKLGGIINPFFTRFTLFLKSSDGIIVGFRDDKTYFVVAAWDKNGIDLWTPKIDVPEGISSS
ncbi:MAG: hypothetical protein WC694_01380 [Candidatus Paceibacterota bacterium]|jgi:hypothetical protein